MTKFDSRLRQQCSKLKFQMDDVVEVLGLSLFPYRKKKQTLLAGTSKGRLPLISLWHLAVFVGTGTRVTPVPPATRFKKGEDRRKKKRKVLHLLRCYTHTHPARAGSTRKGKRKKKADTRRANGQKQRRGGGEQTDLRNQPTRRNGPDQNSAHT